MSQSPPHKKIRQEDGGDGDEMVVASPEKGTSSNASPFGAFDFKYLLKTYWGTFLISLRIRLLIVT